MYLTPNRITVAARVGLVLLWLGFAGLHALTVVDYVIPAVGPAEGALIAWLLALLALLSLPRRTRTDAALLAAILLTFPELVSAAARHSFDVRRWGLEMAFVAAAFVPLIVERVRLRAAVNGYISFTDWNRLDREAARVPPAAPNRAPLRFHAHGGTRTIDDAGPR